MVQIRHNFFKIFFAKKHSDLTFLCPKNMYATHDQKKERPPRGWMQLMVTFNIKNTITCRVRLVEAPPFWGFRLLYATHRQKKARPPRWWMQLIVTFNIKNTITWGLRLVEAPPFWGFRLLCATHRDL